MLVNIFTVSPGKNRVFELLLHVAGSFDGKRCCNLLVTKYSCVCVNEATFCFIYLPAAENELL